MESSKPREPHGLWPPNLIAVTGGLPLFSYHVAFVRPAFAEFLTVLAVLIGLTILIARVMTTRRVDVPRFAVVLSALFCLAFAPHSRTPWFWILAGTGSLLALLGHELRDYPEALIPSDLGATLQVATIPAIYYSVACGFPPSAGLAWLMLVILGVAVFYNLISLVWSLAVWLLCTAEILVMLSVVLTVLPPFGGQTLVAVLVPLPPAVYLLALYMAYADGARATRNEQGSGTLRE